MGELNGWGQMVAWIASGGALTWLSTYLLERRRQRLEERKHADERRAKQLEEERLEAEQKGQDFDRLKKAWEEMRVEMRSSIQALGDRNNSLEQELKRQADECIRQRQEDQQRSDQIILGLRGDMVRLSNQNTDQQLQLNARRVEISHLEAKLAQNDIPGGRRNTDPRRKAAAAAAAPLSISPLVPPGASFDLRVSAPGTPPAAAPETPPANGGGAEA